MKRIPVLLVALLAMALTACTGPTTGTSTASGSDLLARHQLTGKSAKAIIDQLEATQSDKATGLVGSVRPDQLTLTDDLGEQTLSIGDQFYLSVAPYLSRTHECFFHNLATCQGELADAPIAVKVVAQDGRVLVDQKTRTAANGFVGLWLPRDLTAASLTITQDGRSATTPIGTSQDDPTCLTTVQLS